jgi:hypothetical protein
MFLWVRFDPRINVEPRAKDHIPDECAESNQEDDTRKECNAFRIVGNIWTAA